ncbi:MAG: ABC transporter permease, partial [Gammaproteobacteria bacterium]|nr:ABC transporter permease [Gammaproteobacteria bacterium]
MKNPIQNPFLQMLVGRLLGMVTVLFLVSLLVFILTRLASGDPIAMLLGDQASLQVIDEARVRYGLDKSW